MCAGSQPGRGAYGQFVTDCIRYILSKEDVGNRVPGFLYQPNSGHGPMYGHGFATLFLSEVYGMVHEKTLRDELRGSSTAPSNSSSPARRPTSKARGATSPATTGRTCPSPCAR